MPLLSNKRSELAFVTSEAKHGQFANQVATFTRKLQLKLESVGMVKRSIPQ